MYKSTSFKVTTRLDLTIVIGHSEPSQDSLWTWSYASGKMKSTEPLRSVLVYQLPKVAKDGVCVQKLSPKEIDT